MPDLICRPVSTDWFLDQCRSLANHIIVKSDGRVIFCGTCEDMAADAIRRADANHRAALNRGMSMSLEHTFRDVSRGNAILARLSFVR